MKQLIMILLMNACFHFNTRAQGCVAIRSTGNICTSFYNDENGMNSRHWSFTVNNRYFRSFRHFVGSDEQKQRSLLGTQVINYSYTADLTLQHIIDGRWSVSIN